MATIRGIKKSVAERYTLLYDNIKYIDDTDSASDQSSWIKTLEVESKNMVKVIGKTKSKERKANILIFFFSLTSNPNDNMSYPT